MSTTVTEGTGTQAGQPNDGTTPGQQTGQAPANGQPTGQQTGQQDQGQPQDLNSLPEWARAELTRARTEAGQYRTGKNAAEQERDQTRDLLAQVAKTLGLTEDGKKDPEVLAQELTKAQAAQRATAIELQVYRLAGDDDVQVKPDAILDSLKFRTKVEGLDPNSRDFADKIKTAMKETAQENPLVKAGTPPQQQAGASGTDMTGGGKKPQPANLEEAISARIAADAAKAAKQQT